ncbi:MAG: SPOR domain-containing protein [Acidobacteriota bacterium]|nr:SPOR domain-containing protein [Acidobacteriota bacterium]
MELWTEYEGRTIDGNYPLTKLIRPEGRSAFFSTSNGTGVPTVIRLIESHFDDEEILARWRGIEALDHPHLVKLKQFGNVVLDETSLVYAVMEPVEANLAEIVRERRMTGLETRQVASSVLSALEALHANGFVHEHVEAANVLAVGETIKLRSDCIREAPEGEEGRALKARDVHDFAVVLLECLTQQKTPQGAAGELPLIAPFDGIVRKGMNGDWGLPEIANALKSAATPSVSVAAAAKPAPSAVRVDAREGVRDRSVPAAPVAAAAYGASHENAAMRRPIPVDRVEAGGGRAGLGRGAGFRAIVGLLLVAVLFLGWHFLHGRPASEGAAPPPVVATPAPILENRAAPAAQTQAGPAVEGEHAPVIERAAPGVNQESGTGQWRVVAFTYNREAQAREKAASLAARHGNLRPSVFTPTGRAPYLVTLGGGMSREEAFRLAGKAKREGLPRDVYAQNYRGRR